MQARTKAGLLIEIEEVVLDGREMIVRLNGASYVLDEMQWDGRCLRLSLHRGGKLDALVQEMTALQVAIAEARMIEAEVVVPPALPASKKR